MEPIDATPNQELGQGPGEGPSRELLLVARWPQRRPGGGVRPRRRPGQVRA